MTHSARLKAKYGVSMGLGRVATAGAMCEVTLRVDLIVLNSKRGFLKQCADEKECALSK